MDLLFPCCLYNSKLIRGKESVNIQDDYELIITCPPEHVDEIRSLITSMSPMPVTDIGRITDISGDIQLTSTDGISLRVSHSGWDHFTK